MPNNPPATPRRIGDLDEGPLANGRIFEIAIDDVFVPDDMRPVDEETVSRIVESIETLGLQSQGILTVEWNPVGDPHRATLIAGRHRLEAFRRLGWATVLAVIFEGSAAEAELWRIAENLCRKELSILDRAEEIARWIELRGEKPAQDARVSGGRGHKGGISAAARELNIDRRTVQRGVRVAGLTDEAKTVARRLNLDDDQRALEDAVDAGGTAEQIAALEEKARRNEQARRRTAGLAAAAKQQAAKIGGSMQREADWSACAAESLLEWLGTERSKQLLDMIDKAGGGAVAITIIDRLRRLLRDSRV
jgi:ParB family chromosome partitioning protein